MTDNSYIAESKFMEKDKCLISIHGHCFTDLFDPASVNMDSGKKFSFLFKVAEVQTESVDTFVVILRD